MKATIFAIAFLFVQTVFAQVTEEWTRIYNGPGNNTDVPYCVGTDSAGNVFVSGISKGMNSGICDLTTVKYNPLGVLQWVNVYDGPAHLTDQPEQMVVDAAGNCYIAGNSQNTVLSDPILLKIDPNGNQSWIIRMNGFGTFSKIQLDQNGNIFASGFNNDSIIAVKCNSSGSILWQKHISSDGYIVTQMQDMSLDADNNIYIGGSCYNQTVELSDAYMIKLNSGGTKLWDFVYNGTLNNVDNFTSVKADTHGNVYAVMFSDSINFIRPYINKYSGSGNLLWSKRIYTFFDRGIFIDKCDNIFVGGFVRNNQGYNQPGVIKFNKYGENILNMLQVPYGSSEAFMNFTMDAYSNIYVASTHTITDSVSFTRVTKFNSNGIQKWSITKAGNLKDTGTTSLNAAITVSNQRNVFLAATGLGRMSQDDYLTVKYDQPFHTVSGIVTYKDNGLPVTHGWAKALYYDKSSAGIIVVDSSAIQSDGHYILQHIPDDTLDIMFYQNDDELDFVPTYYVSTTDWQQAAKIYAAVNLTNINGQVYRISNPGNTFSISGTANANSYGESQSPLNDAIIYVQSGTSYMNYGISNSNGIYIADKLPPGSYNLTACRMGYAPATQNVTITNSSITNLIFNFGDPIGVHSPGTEIPSGFVLHQNYPNPFNPATIIKFDLPKSENVKITIYDVTGRLVNVLVNEELKAGSYSVKWDASVYASGIYFYRIETKDFAETKKMLLIK